MKITVERITSDDESTISAVFVDGQFVCFGLEDEYREHKVSCETRIPAGSYGVDLKVVGGFHTRYRRKFSDIHKGMLRILDVPNFEHILIHVGNTEANTAGCLLVGTGATARRGDMSIQSSVEAYKHFYGQVVQSAANGDLTIEFIDRDRNMAT